MGFVGRTLLLLVLWAGAAGAQERTPVPAPGPEPDASVGAALRSLAARAGVVFVGRVESIERKGGVVEVRFSVQQAVLGAVGATYTLREWGGLWTGGQRRYVMGQRAMVFLHAPSAAGLSSPVDGMEGVVPVVPMGADAAALLDVRLLATRVRRAVGEPMTVEAIALPDAVASMVAEPKMEPVTKRLPVGWRPMPIEVPVAMKVGDQHAAQ